MGVSLLLIAALVAGMVLPSFLMEWQDAQRVGRSQLWEGQEVVLTDQSNMTLGEKTTLINSETANRLPVVNGRRYSAENVREHMREELGKLKDLGILWDYEEDNLAISTEAWFIMDEEDSQCSLMVWDSTGITNDSYIGWIMDDESGKILSIHQNFRDSAAASGYSGMSEGTDGDRIYQVVEKDDPVREKWAMDILEAWAEYLECTLLDTDYKVWIPDGSMEVANSIELELLIQEFIEQGLSEKEAYIKAAKSLGLEIMDEEYNIYGTLEDEKGQVIYRVYLESDGRGMAVFFI